MVVNRLVLFAFFTTLAFSKESLDFQKQLREAEKFSKEIHEEVIKNVEKFQQELFFEFGVPEDAIDAESLKEKTLDGSAIFDESFTDVKESVKNRAEVEDLPELTEKEVQKSLGITAKKETTQPQKRELKKCTEGMLLEKRFGFRSLQVLVKRVEEIEREVKVCQGCLTTKKFIEKHEADQFAKEQRDLAFNPASSVETFRIDYSNPSLYKQPFGKGKYKISVFSKHRHDSPDCSNYKMEKMIIQPGSHTEEDVWIEDESLQQLASDPKCVVISTKTAPSFSARMINGVIVKRPIWQQKVTFACGSQTVSECQKLREENCSMISKKCTTEKDSGECLTWEKTYSCGGSAETTEIELEGEDLVECLDGKGFDDSYDLNEDFGEVITTLSSFADVKKQAEEEGTVDVKNLNLFNGKHFSCSKVFSSKIKDCCQVISPEQKKEIKGKGGLIVFGLESCSDDEKCLARKRGQEACVFVGDSRKDFLTKKFHYCCFSSKLARVIQQEARKQLDLDWGEPDNPTCRGLTKEEIARLDFASMDLSEVIEDLPEIDEQQLKKRLRSLEGTTRDLQSKMTDKNEESRSKALENLQKISGGSP